MEKRLIRKGIVKELFNDEDIETSEHIITIREELEKLRKLVRKL